MSRIMIITKCEVIILKIALKNGKAKDFFVILLDTPYS
jgi:hypothetical protein